MRKAAPVPEVRLSSGITPERFEAEYVRAATPVVFRGFVADWPARQWTFPAMEGWGRKHVRLRSLSGEAGRGAAVDLPLEELARELADETPRAPGAASQWVLDVLGDAPDLTLHMPPPRIHRGPIEYAAFLGRDTMHDPDYHPFRHSLLCQVHGKKRVILYSPEQTSLLYPHPVLRTPNYHGSRADFRSPDLRAFPRLAEAEALETVVEPGDALFIPLLWWHGVYGEGPVFSASMFWYARLRDHRLSRVEARNLVGALRWRGWWPMLYDAIRWA